jgi:rare lipoprotein A
MSGVKLPLMIAIGLMLIYDGYSLAFHRNLSPVAGTGSGLASWYGREEQGSLTADGERFDRHAFTAASRDLPFNTVVRVTNQSNGHHVDVRINDRGPFRKSRILDLSEAAADTLDMKTSGTAPVKIEVVVPASAQASIAP